MEKISCEVVRDLLPLYADGVASGDTGALVSEHLRTCAACGAEYEKMRRRVALPAETDAGPLKRLKRKMKRKRALLVCVTALAAFALALGLAAYAYAPVIFQRGDPVPYLSAAARLGGETPFVRVDAGGDGAVYISRRGTCDALLDYIAESRRLTFREQLGSAYLFSDGERTLAVESEVYLARFTVWEVPEG